MQKVKEQYNNIFLNIGPTLPALTYTEKKELKNKIQSAIDKIGKDKG